MKKIFALMAMLAMIGMSVHDVHAAASLAGPFNQQFFKSPGQPCNQCTLNFYDSGTTNPRAVYTDATQAVSLGSSITLNSRGEASTGIYMNGSYTVVLKTPAGQQIWSRDGITGISDASLTAVLDRWSSTGLTPTYVAGTQFTTLGDNTLVLVVGRRIKIVVSAGTIYGRIKSSSFGGGLTTTTVDLDSGAIDTGISSVSVGLENPTNTAISVDSIGTGTNPNNMGWTGTENHTGAEAHSGTETHSGNVNSSGTNTFSGKHNITGDVVSSGSNTWNGNQTINGNVVSNGSNTFTGPVSVVSGGSFTTSPGASKVPMAKSDGVLASGWSGLLNIQYLTSAGTGTYTPTTGTHKIIVEMCGGGAGGGGINTGGGNCGAGAGGAGGYAKKYYTNIISGGTYTYTVGAAGNGGSAGNHDGLPGGNSYFYNSPLSSLVTASSGTGGLGTASGTSTGGIGGSATNGDINISGGNGSGGFGSTPKAGQGGNSQLGQGGLITSATGNSAGVDGTGYCSGGSGAQGGTGSGNYAGGNGKPGIIIIYEFI